jgi:hypothetical protein
MRYLAMVAMLAAMASPAFAQDPNRNRMNDPYPEAKQQECAGCIASDFGLPSMYGNRMNVMYSESGSRELTGGPNPSGNRMNMEWPKVQPKPEPKKTMTEPVYPEPRP